MKEPFVYKEKVKIVNGFYRGQLGIVIRRRKYGLTGCGKTYTYDIQMTDGVTAYRVFHQDLDRRFETL